MAILAAVILIAPQMSRLRDFEHSATYLPLPIGLLLGLVWLAWGDKLRIVNGEL